MNNIKLFRLINGEEVVGELEESASGTYTIKNPCAIGLVPTATGQVTLNMQPWLIFSDSKSVTIKDDHILFKTGVDIKILNKYNEIFGSGIVIAQQTPTLAR
jgi:hypothetical protein